MPGETIRVIGEYWSPECNDTQECSVGCTGQSCEGGGPNRPASNLRVVLASATPQDDLQAELASGVAANQELFVQGLARSTATNASVLGSTIPVFTALIAIVLGRERAQLRRLAGIAIAFAAVAALVGADRMSMSSDHALGSAMILINSLCYGTYLVVVRPLAGQGGETRYEIVAGERRWRAAQLAGLDTVPALVRDVPDEAAVAIALIENIQRENLNPIEEADALRRLVEEFGMTHEHAAEAVGRSRASVSNLLRLLDLPEAVRAMLARRELDMGHARALLAIGSPQLLVEIARRAVRDGWSVRETERAASRVAAQGGPKRATRARAADPNIVRLETELGEKLGAVVAIEHGTKGGRIVIRYHSVDELEGILGHIE